MKPCARHRDRRAALPSVDDADIISLAEALARGMKPSEAVCMTQYTISLKSTLKPNKTNAELREMLAQAVRNTQPKPQDEPKPLPKTKKGRR